MPETKFFYNTEDIIRAIVKKYGSIENFAKEMGYSKANAYQKIKSQTAKFIRGLEDKGINIHAEEIGNQTTHGDNSQAIGIAKNFRYNAIEKDNNENIKIMGLQYALELTEGKLAECTAKLNEKERLLMEANSTIAKLREKLNEQQHPDSNSNRIQVRQKK